MSHLHAIIRPNHFDFNVRVLCISALMSKTMHQIQIRRWVLSVIRAYDLQYYHSNSHPYNSLRYL